MKITRSGKTTLKFLTDSKREQLYEIMDEYSSLVNFFIAMFWGKSFTRKDLTKDITGQAVTWLSARMRQCAAREALGMVQAAVLSAKELGKDAVMPVHSGKKMILSAQVVRIEKGRNSFDMWLVLSSVGNGIKISIPLKSHGWKRSTTVIIHREYVQFSFETETGAKAASGACVGLDVGINTLIVTSKKEFEGPDVKPLINKIKRKEQGSKAYKRAKRELSYYLHKVTKDWFAGHNDLRL
ncbi:MAG: hypothetical protein GY862_38140, partial [Gammaproteobacteria bacterium]|nr:hypothetical protein [Gammaproteobacteria bacterium]